EILYHVRFHLFFLQAEDGIRDRNVTGVQTCALPILFPAVSTAWANASPDCCRARARRVDSSAEVLSRCSTTSAPDARACATAQARRRRDQEFQSSTASDPVRSTCSARAPMRPRTSAARSP